MSDATALLEEADRLLDENEYRAALEQYREAALATLPSAHLLANLSVAEDQDRLAFRRVLKERFPQSLECRLSEVGVLIAIAWYDQAVRSCTELLNTSAKNTLDKVRIHRLRLRAAVSGGDCATLDEDFLAIWRAGDTHPAAERIRMGLVKDLARVGDPTAARALRRIGGQQGIPREVKKFIDGKASELLALDYVAHRPERLTVRHPTEVGVVPASRPPLPPAFVHRIQRFIEGVGEPYISNQHISMVDMEYIEGRYFPAVINQRDETREAILTRLEHAWAENVSHRNSQWVRSLARLMVGVADHLLRPTSLESIHRRDAVDVIVRLSRWHYTPSNFIRRYKPLISFIISQIWGEIEPLP
jgi:hypothetical protein